MSVDADPTSPGFNSYVSEADADALAALDLHTDNWDGASSAVKEQALIMCTGLLDTYVEWFGVATESNQNLGWPRRHVRVPNRALNEYFDATVVPDLIKLATFRYASVLVAENILADQETGLTGLGVGSINLRFSRIDRKAPVPRIVRDMLRDVGYVRVGTGYAKLVRT